MAIITLTTDFGNQSHYIAILKGRLISLIPNATIIDLTHSIEPQDIGHAQFIINNSLEYFPENTIHVICVALHSNKDFRILINNFNGSYFLAPDNGILTLINQDPEISLHEFSIIENPNTFKSIENITQSVFELINNNYDLSFLGNDTENFIRKFNEKPFLLDDTIRIKIIYIDNFGNAYFNISKSEFYKLTNFKKFEIVINESNERGKLITEIKTHLTEVEIGEIAAYFPIENHLVIGMNGHKAHFNKLFGKKTGDYIRIELNS